MFMFYYLCENVKVNFMVALKLLFKHNFYGGIKVYEFTWRVLVVSKGHFL